MDAVFMELPAFERYREHYLGDDAFAALQRRLLGNPLAGAVIPGSGGLRKLRWRDERRQKGTRGGLRVIYYFWESGAQYWLFTVYDKSEIDDLTAQQRRALSELLVNECRARAGNG